MSNYSYLIKFIVIGDTGVGKSCLVLRFTEEKFRLNHDVTIGVEFASKLIKMDGLNIKLQIWDTAGQENFRSITRSYYRSACGVLLVYDITRKETFRNLEKWIEEVKEHGSTYVNFILLGNKCDKDANCRQVSYDEGQEFATKHNLIFFEASALNSKNVDAAFTKCTEEIYTKINNKKIPLNNEFSGIKEGPELVNVKKKDDRVPDDNQNLKPFIPQKKSCCK